MSKKIIIAANWKMYLNFKESLELAKKIKDKFHHPSAPSFLRKGRGCLEMVICPSFTVLADLSKLLKGTKIQLGAQDAFWGNKGAYTGEISPDFLKEVGCRYVIIGHSERRRLLGETDETVNLKLKAALAKNLIPILCVGETEKEKNAGKGMAVIADQIKKATQGLKIKEKDKIIVAYEPVWAIGANLLRHGGGKSATSEEAEKMAEEIKKVLIKLYSVGKAKNNFSVLYGGSVDGSNINSFIAREHIDGVLVGGASVKLDEFVKITENTNADPLLIKEG